MQEFEAVHKFVSLTLIDEDLLSELADEIDLQPLPFHLFFLRGDVLLLFLSY